MAYKMLKTIGASLAALGIGVAISQDMDNDFAREYFSSKYNNSQKANTEQVALPPIPEPEPIASGPDPPPHPEPLRLNKGWNLLVYTGSEPMYPEDAFADVLGDVELVHSGDGNPGHMILICLSFQI